MLALPAWGILAADRVLDRGLPPLEASSCRDFVPAVPSPRQIDAAAGLQSIAAHRHRRDTEQPTDLGVGDKLVFDEIYKRWREVVEVCCVSHTP